MHISQRGSEQALVGKAVIFVRMREKEVFKRRERAEKGREELEWKKGGKREMPAFLMEVFLLH